LDLEVSVPGSPIKSPVLTVDFSGSVSLVRGGGGTIPVMVKVQKLVAKEHLFGCKIPFPTKIHVASGGMVATELFRRGHDQLV
jgi:hypothetical protein